MNCYDCAHLGRTTSAIAICHDCGAGLCTDHTTQGQHTLTVVLATSTRYSVDPPQRRIRCHTCAAAVDRADELSLAEVSRPMRARALGRRSR